MRNWLAGIFALFGLLFFFFLERNIWGFIVLTICAVVAAVLFSESELQTRIRKQKQEKAERKKTPKNQPSKTSKN
jgi:hypothetical protein